MIKYILYIILGIIIYILLNNVNRFSIGVAYETETRTFYNPDVPFIHPQDIQYIKWRESESTQPLILLNTYANTLPPIYLGRFKKDPEDGPWYEPSLGLGWRHFFIIDKKLYYFEEITESGQPMLKPKNYGERDREPVVLINDDLNASATLVVTERRIGKSICDSYDSVFKLNLGEVRVSDASSDILVTDLVTDIYKSILPVLEYKGVKLLHIHRLADGGFGLVLVVSNIPYSEFNRSADEGRVAIALSLKIYRSDPRDREITGQNDPEM
jgi:hypothetical protein